MPLTTHTLTLTTLEPDNATPVDGKWRVWFTTEHGVALNNAGGMLAGSDIVTTASGVATFTLPDTAQTGFDPAGAYYRAAFVSTDRRVRLTSEPFLMDGNKTTADIFIPTDLPITPSLVARAETAAEAAEAALAGFSGVTAAVTSVNTRTGAIVLTKSDVGLGNVDNTSDASKPVSTAQAAADTVVQSAAATDATTKANAATSAAATALASHEADTTNIHGITNTANLETTSGAQSKADAAQAAAIAASQPLDSDLTAIAALSTTAYGRAFLALANQGALMALMAAATDTSSGIVELATSAEVLTGTDTVRAVTPAGVKAAVDALVNSAPGALDTLGEIATQLASDESAVSALTTTVAGKLAKASNLSDLTDASAARTNLGLGSAATTASTAYDAAGAAAAAQAASQPLDSDLTAIAALTTTSYGRAFLALADAAAGRTALGLGTAATSNTGDFDAAGAASTAQAFAIQRANHTGTQAESTVTNLVSDLAAKATTLTRTAVKTANYTAALWDLVPCDTSGGAFTVTLPAASGGKGRIAIKLVVATNTLNLALTGSDHFNTSAGPTTGTLTLANQAIILESDGSGIWTTTADDLPLSVLDARYQGLDADLTTLAGVTTGDNDKLAQVKAGAIALRTPAQVKTDLSLTKGDVGLGSVDNLQQQPLDATLTAIAALTTAANKLIYATGSDAFTTTDLTAFARTILDDADAATARDTLNVYSRSEAGAIVKNVRRTGAIGETYSRAGAPAVNAVALVSGQQTFVALPVVNGQVISTITFLSGTTAAGTPTNQWFSLYNGTTKIAVTNDDTTTAWTANTEKTLTLSSPYTVTADGVLYLGCMVKATTVPTLIAATGGATALSLAPRLTAIDSTNTGLTTPATAPATATFANTNIYCWAWVA